MVNYLFLYDFKNNTLDTNLFIIYLSYIYIYTKVQKKHGPLSPSPREEIWYVAKGQIIYIIKIVYLTHILHMIFTNLF